MRNPERIPVVLERIKSIWEKLPDYRFMQLLGNVFRGDAYYIEDDEFIKILEQFYGGKHGKKRR